MATPKVVALFMRDHAQIRQNSSPLVAESPALVGLTACWVNSETVTDPTMALPKKTFGIDFRTVQGAVARRPGMLAIAVLISILLVASNRAQGQSHAAPMSVAETADYLDTAFEDIWRNADVRPAKLATRSTFLRRIYLDLLGRIPSVAEARRYLRVESDLEPAQQSARRRRDLITELLSRGVCSDHMANRWRSLLLNSTAENVRVRSLAPALQTWLRLRIAYNIPYDDWVRELLTVPLPDNDPNPFSPQTLAATPLAFYEANRRSPQELAAATSRLFLGVQVQCAECHDHPHAHWTQKGFWSYAAFFDTLQGNGERAVANNTDIISIAIPETELTAVAKFLDGSSPKTLRGQTRRQLVSEWITDEGNPYFARAAVNRVWEKLFGRGLVDPVDALDTGTSGTANTREILSTLADQFVAHDFEFRYLLESIVSTRLYRLSSGLHVEAPQDSDVAMKYFARMPVRRLTAEQLFDSLVQATGLKSDAPAPQQLAIGLENDARTEFVRLFETTESSLEAQTTILQALTLMNGEMIADVTRLETSQFLAAVVSAPFMDERQIIETLFLATVSRFLDDDERRRMASYLRSQKADGIEAETAYADILWALLNSAEFSTNH